MWINDDVKRKGSRVHAAQILTALILIPCVIYCVLWIIHAVRNGHWMNAGILPIPFICIIGLYHGMLGMRIIIEDYISCSYMRCGMIWGLYLITLMSCAIYLVLFFCYISQF